LSHPAEEEIRFGTDGWRAVVAEGFTFRNLRLVTQAYADCLMAERGKGGLTPQVVVGYDTRFLSSAFAREAAAVLAANGIRVFFPERFIPSPVVSWAVRELSCRGGVVITASHNPAEYQGFKIKDSFGGSALPELTRRIEERLRENLRAGRHPRRISFDAAFSGGGIRPLEVWSRYAERLGELVDLERVGRMGFRVVVDPMYGATQGYLSELLRKRGLSVREIRGEVNPAFPGINPEPIARNLGALRMAVLEERASAGLALDGDGDRIGAVDEKGEFVDPHRIMSLLLRHLVEDRGWRGVVAKTFAVTEMVDKLGKKYGLKVIRLPVGFKHVCRLILEGEDVLIGGEESGGIGVKRHIPERDGILAGLLLLEMMAWRQKSLGELVEELFREVGPHHYERVDLHLPREKVEKLMERLSRERPSSFAGIPVREVDDLDGFKFFLDHRGWLLIRPSGTEPLVRVYGEMDDRGLLKEVVSQGVALARQD